MKWEIRQKVDLQVMTPQRATPECLFMVGNAQAHRWKVEVYSGGTPVDIDGRLVVAMVQRPDGLVAMLKGISKNNVAEVVLDSACCGVAGHAQALMTLTSNDQVITVAEMRFRVGGDMGDTVIDSSDMLPSLSELLSQVADMRAATDECVAATDEMRELLENAGSVGGSSGTGGTGGTGTVTSVNGIKPDAAGNVEMEIPQAADDVGADPAGTAASEVSTHNADEDAHPAIRQLISDLSGRLSALADSDDTTLDQLSEIVAYIKSNKSLIDSITTGKVSTADIVNNLTSTATNKPLSAAQGRTLKTLIDAIEVPTKTSQLTNDSGYLTQHQDISHLLPRAELGAAVDTALAEAKASGAFDGEDGVGVASIYQKTTSIADGGENVYVVELTDGTVSNFKVRNGSKGSDGKSAYAYAQDGGYTGTEAAFAAKLAEPAFDPKAYDIPVLYLTGSTDGMTKDDAVTLTYACEDKDGNAKSGTCAVKWQGSSSLAYAKKNYTIKFDNAFEVVDGWTAQKKYCFKANFIDHSHARNLVSCKLWGQIVKSRAGVDSRLTALPNAGAVDGFPCVIMLNGEFHGLYTWNIPKDGWMFGMEDSETVQQAIVCGDKYTDSTDFEALAALDGTDYELEYCSTSDTSWVKTSFNRMLQAVIDSNGGDIDTTLAQYIDIDSAIDYMIDTVLVEAADCMSKNTLYVTYDGVKWFMSAYDRDSTFGLHWHGKDFSGLASVPTFVAWQSHRLMNLLWTYKREAIRTRYEEIRGGAMSEANVAKTLWNFVCYIPKALLLKDVEKWPSIPSSAVNDAHQILHQYRLRCELADEWIQDTSGEKEPPTEDSGYTNLVATSIDTDGSIFNGVGYKDEYRLNSSGAVAAQTDSTATGFMPAAKGDVFRITGVRFGTSATAGVYGYVSIYDTSKTKLQSVSVDAYLGSPSSYGFAITPTPSSGYVYPTDVYTIDFANAPDSMAFVRFSSSIAPIDNIAKQSGADMIVTVNEEIT